ncbi:Sporulation inhibitor A [Paenibacillus sp. UNCCL117]|uniref:sporulation histidine kinase inhibitor Sda n=1 Tax=unclassified Paenibacillus TaxID=185978 RepID=UPI000890560B|nr:MULTISPECIES: sporulation histidine kinase inhibitor Sda [unclassified Paenibacillus]SDC06535.1 Sporulation inhibitor A [Paenibacillus sp. cl123]SFW37842.1 Sporulation inhibitor A [Paenibacillus sp. UNCCL117]
MRWLSDQDLTAAYTISVKLQLDGEFIELLLQELQSRKLSVRLEESSGASAAERSLYLDAGGV